MNHSVDHYSGSQVASDQPQHPFVTYRLSDPRHQNVVVDPVKELGDVHVRHPDFARLDVSLRCSNGLVLAATAPESVAVLAKSWIKDPLEPP
jgi:hypothetical protein